MTMLETAMGRRDAALARGDLKAVKEAQFVCDLEAAQLRMEIARLQLDKVSKEFADAIEGLLRMRLDEVL